MMNQLRPFYSLLPVLLTGCSANAPNNPSGPTAIDELVTGIAEEQIVRGIEEFSCNAMKLVDSADVFCESPDEKTIANVRQIWLTSAKTWYRVQLFNFGPADANAVFPLFTFIDSLRLRGDDYTDSLNNQIGAWIDSEDELDSEFFAKQRFNDVGLLGVELALYGSESTLADYAKEPRRCAILLGLSSALRVRARELEKGWVDEFEHRDEPFVELLIADDLPSGRGSLAQIVIAAQQYLDYLHRRRVVTLAGKASGTGWQLVEQGLDAVEELLTVDHGGKSIFYWMERLGDKGDVEKVRADLEAAQAAVDDEDREAFEAAVAALDGDFKREVPRSLDITLGLTLSDGD